MNYIVIEIQRTNVGTCSQLVTAYTERQQAESNYHRVLQYAAVSELPAHTAVLMDDVGNVYAKQTYYHGGASGDDS